MFCLTGPMPEVHVFIRDLPQSASHHYRVKGCIQGVPHGLFMGNVDCRELLVKVDMWKSGVDAIKTFHAQLN